MLKFLSSLFGSKKEKDVQSLLPIVEEINQHNAQLQSLTDDELRAKTQEFKTRIAQALKETRGEIERIQTELKSEFGPVKREELFNELEALEKEEYEIIKETLNEILPEAFAVAKETCRRL